MTATDLQFVDQVVATHGRGPEAVIPILQALQDRYRYLPGEALERVCDLTDIAPSAITGVSTFYTQFRHQPVGKYIIRACHGTACHVKGITLVEDALRRHLKIPEGADTDPNNQFTIERVGCLGCCTLAPAVQVESHTYGHLTAERAAEPVRDFLRHYQANGRADPADLLARYTTACGSCTTSSAMAAATSASASAPGAPARAEIRIGLGSCCIAKGSGRLYDAMRDAVDQMDVPVEIKPVGCVGMCHRTPMVELSIGGRPGVYYDDLSPSRVRDVIARHFQPRNPFRRVRRWISRGLDHLLTNDAPPPISRHAVDVRDPAVTAFLDPQHNIATEHYGEIEPLNLDQYLMHDGFKALGRCVHERRPVDIIQTIDGAGLRGRGGGGFPVGRKWTLARAAESDTRYLICNGDEGDPGAFMDRMLLESFPYRVIEGMMIAAWAVGARNGIFYIRHEYPLAVRRVREAITRCRARGIIGPKVLGSDFSFDVTIREGAGAFVCGEETALIASLEGERGMPRLRPPYPVQSGLHGKPTVVNNVETLAMVPWILRHGAAEFAAIGTEKSKGTKVFALAGKVQRGGLIEVPMGTTIREIVEQIGGGALPGRRFKAVQVGGPSGGCVPASLADTPVDYEALREVGAIMGSGGLVVLDDTDCMVDIARYFLQFTQAESCGKCTFCRIGTRRMLDVLDRICAGKGKPRDLDELETLAGQISAGSICGLGMTAPNPVLTTLRYFRDEYEAHLAGRCPAGRCQALISYDINEKCIGCTICAQHCPVNAIPMTPYQRHVIDDTICTRCDVCRQVCPEDAIDVF